MELKELIELFADQFDETDMSEIQPETNYQDLEEWSSLTAMGIIAMAKTNFGKKITGLEVRNCKTVKQLYDLILSK